jgi:hypothetical protein
MPTAWFIAPYKAKPHKWPFRWARYCTMDDYTDAIRADGGDWSEVEILGNRAIVKVRASVATLATLAGVFKRLPKDRLDDSLADLPQAVRRALRDEALDQGYSLAEVQARFGDDLAGYRLRDVLRFMATRRRKARYDAANDLIVLDGAEVACSKTLETLDDEVSE